jgi:TPR repeat protein
MRPQPTVRSGAQQARWLRRFIVSLLLSAVAPVALATGLAPAAAPIKAEPIDATPIEAAPIHVEPIEATPLQQPPIRLPDTFDPAVLGELDALRRVATGRTRAAGQAAWQLGLIHLHGAGVPQDSEEAQRWFERAHQLKTSIALAGLAWCEIDGCQSFANPAAARQWLTPLRRTHLPRAQYLEWLVAARLAPLRLARPGLENDMIDAPLPARALLLRAARAGDVHALIELGMDSVAAGRSTEALQYFRAAAPKSAVAAVNAAIVSDSLRIIPTLPADASRMTLELLAQARRHHRGEGTPANYTEAIRYYRLAEAQGSEEATRMLALIFSRPLVNGGLDVAWIKQLGELDLSQETPSRRTGSGQRQLQREATPLIDFLPEVWRRRIP